MAEAIVYLLILVCVVGGPWLTMTILTKPKRRKGHGTKLSFENYFATAAPRRPVARKPTQAPPEKPAPVADKSPEDEEYVPAGRNSALALLPPIADAVVPKPESRLFLSSPRCEPKV
jgi:hypothetical protein